MCWNSLTHYYFLLPTNIPQIQWAFVKRDNIVCPSFFLLTRRLLSTLTSSLVTAEAAEPSDYSVAGLASHDIYSHGSSQACGSCLSVQPCYFPVSWTDFDNDNVVDVSITSLLFAFFRVAVIIKISIIFVGSNIRVFASLQESCKVMRGGRGEGEFLMF